jgi:hypothetical protein
VKALGRGLDYGFSLLACVGVTFTAFAFGSLFFSRTAGGLLAVGAFVLTLAFVLNSYLEERRARYLVALECPRCHAALVTEHQHRRWQHERQSWLPPVQLWDCKACGFSHSTGHACATCPEPG